MSSAPGAAVAVLIAAYNAEATLERAVVSALAQPETGEVCIVDDGSTDATATLARALAARDARVAFHQAPLNAGPAAARNWAIAATRAPWLAVLDADDYLLDGRFAPLLASASDADFVADALMRVTDGPAPPTPHTSFRPEPLMFTEFVLGNLGRTHGALDLGFLKPIFRRAFLDRHGLRYQDHLRLGEDYEFYARALALGARFLVGGPTGYVSVERAGSLSKAHDEGDLERLRDCDDGLVAITSLGLTERRALNRHWTSVDCRLQWRRLIAAVKGRDLRAALSTFHTPSAALYLTVRLGEQALVRTGRLLGDRDNPH
ncbi:MAG: glycosyltransferase [Terricaulis sp.]